MSDIKDKLSKSENVKRDVPLTLEGIHDGMKFAEGRVQGSTDPARHWLRSLRDMLRCTEVKAQSEIEQERAFAHHQKIVELRDILVEAAVKMKLDRRRGTPAAIPLSERAFHDALEVFMEEIEIE